MAYGVYGVYGVSIEGKKVHKAASTVAKTSVAAMPHFRFENFTTLNGLPDDHVFSVLVDGDWIWAGTENGLGLYYEKWKAITTKDELAHCAVLSLALDKRTGVSSRHVLSVVFSVPASKDF